ncbi:MAG: PTS sugar transporter subunit IIA [Pseudomonadota bacterium]
MGFDDLLKPEGVVHNLKARCKREALELIAETAANLSGRPAGEIIETLLKREQLGSTGVGDGVAIPHGKIKGLSEITGVLALLEHPVSFEALDDQPVDLVFVLLAPANATAAHLKALAKISRLLRDEETRAALRGSESAEALFAAATATQKPDAA